MPRRSISSKNPFQIGSDCIGVGAGALIFNDEGKLLLSLRGKAAKNERGKWEIPGGAIEFGETIESGLKREIKEEIGVDIEVVEMLQLADHILPDEGQHWVSPTYICKIISGTPNIMEPEKCERLEWFSLDEAAKLPLSDVTIQDVAILNKKKLESTLEHIGCCVILQNDQSQILLGKRKNSYKSGYFGIPGGRVEKQETLADCATRELMEEVGIKPVSLEYLGVVKEWQDDHNFIHFVFVCTKWDGEIKLMEPDKSEAWEWYDIDNLPGKIIPGHEQGIDLLINRTRENLRDL